MRSRTVRIVALAVAVVLSVGVLGVPASTAQPGTTQPWTDRHLSPEQRARLLMAQMTLAEKVDLLSGNTGEGPYALQRAIPRLGIPALKMADAESGVARAAGHFRHRQQRDRNALGNGAWHRSSIGTSSWPSRQVREMSQNVLLGTPT
jgi:beta-glucosidase